MSSIFFRTTDRNCLARPSIIQSTQKPNLRIFPRVASSCEMDEVLSLPKPLSLNIEELRRASPSVEDFVAEVYGVLRIPLISYVYHLLGSTRDAEDVVQVAFVRLFAQLSSGAEMRNVRGWLYCVAHNVAVEMGRSVSRRETLLRSWLPLHQESTDTLERDVIRRDRIKKALSILSEKEYQCLMLRAEGFTYKEIAEVIGTTDVAVSGALARGLKKFESRNEQ